MRQRRQGALEVDDGLLVGLHGERLAAGRVRVRHGLRVVAGAQKVVGELGCAR
jgi:hypothetical protein